MYRYKSYHRVDFSSPSKCKNGLASGKGDVCGFFFLSFPGLLGII